MCENLPTSANVACTALPAIALERLLPALFIANAFLTISSSGPSKSSIESLPIRSGRLNRYRCRAWSLIIIPYIVSFLRSIVWSEGVYSNAFSTALAQQVRCAMLHVPQILDVRVGRDIADFPLIAWV